MVLVLQRRNRQIGGERFRGQATDIILVIVARLHHGDALARRQGADVVVVCRLIGRLPGGGPRGIEAADDEEGCEDRDGGPVRSQWTSLQTQCSGQPDPLEGLQQFLHQEDTREDR